MTSTVDEPKKVREPSAQEKEFCVQYEQFVKSERAKWRANNPPPNELWELMSDREREVVYRLVDNWKNHITPLAEAWWKERGYIIHWPADDKGSCWYSRAN
jgi:hypothetical protein